VRIAKKPRDLRAFSRDSICLSHPTFFAAQPGGDMSLPPLGLRSVLFSALSPLFLGALASAQAPSADFSGAPTIGIAPLEVTFSDFSTGNVTGYFWNFGDGQNSAVQNPTHVYSASGTYTVALTVVGPQGTDTALRTDYVVVQPPAPVAEFTGAPTIGSSPTTVSFADASTGTITTWFWNFGDKSTSTQENPSHVYSDPGTYTVSLTVAGPGGVDTESKLDYVVVSFPAPVSDFSATPSSGPAPLTVQFTSLATGEVSTGSWAFGDGSTSVQQSPAHTYTTPGTYTVSLEVTGPGGSDIETKNDFIVVTEPLPVASFSGSPLTGLAPLTVSFTDSSGGTTTSWAWTFGDGGTSSEQNPAHTYSSPGSYTVSLTASGPSGDDLKVENDYVVVQFPPPSAGFTGTPLSGVAPLTVNFTDSSLGVITGRSWSFGDSGTANGTNPSHVYAEPGTYAVSLTVTGPGGTDVQTNNNYVTVLEPPPAANFTGTPSAGVAPLTVDFTDFSVGNITGHAWDFGDGGTSNLANPTHTFASAGVYTVSLTVTSAGGVDTETRTNYITVAEPVPVAEFAASATNGSGTLTTSFSDLSTGVVTVRSWNFGDGATSFAASPTHTYSAPGTYTVSLTVGGPGGIDTETKPDYITVDQPAPVANFTAMPSSGDVPLTVSFTDLTSGLVSSWSWDFGDGGTGSVQNPLYTYTSSGTYSVTLTATGPGGSAPETKTDYIVVSEQAPIAEFSATPTTGVAPLSVSFTDLSAGGPATNYSWSFGDGGSSSSASPSHVYAAAGTYTVALTLTGPGGVDTETKLELITVTPPAPVASFTGGPLSGNAPLTVAFTDTSTGDVSGWSWSFGDLGTSAVQNPTHTYNDPGTYSVSLTAVGPGGSNTDTRSGLVVVSEPVPDARFFGVPRVGVAPLAVSFTDTSVGNVSGWAWTFGDGGSSSTQSPSHTYSSPGIYTVSLTVSSAGGSDTENKVNYVVVTEPAPVADFSGAPTSGAAPLTVNFSDASTGAVTSYLWDFGDNTTSTVQNPIKVYPSAGSYTVTLTVVGPGGIATRTESDYVVVGFPAPTAEFVGAPSSGIVPLTVIFTDQSSGVSTSWFWNFGDGGISSAQNPTKVYAIAGTYTVALTATGPGGSSTETKTDYIVAGEPAPVASFTGSPTSGQVPLTVTFSDTSTGVATGWSWNFGDGGSSTLQNPSYTYNAAGNYTVSLTVTGPGGSDTDVLIDYIAVADLPPVADFAGVPLTGVAPHTVDFTNLTSGVSTDYVWDFGDGGGSSQSNPSHTYTSAGTYTVALTATGPGGADTETKPAYVTVLEPPPVADFTATPLSGSAPLIVSFTDASVGAVNAWSWSFGDGGISNGQDPTHIYIAAGTYTVSLTVTSPGGVDSETKTDYITVDLSLDDGSFEGQVAGGAPASPWTVLGAGHVIQPDSGALFDGDFPTDAAQWADLSSAGSNAATPPSNPGGAGVLPSGTVGIAQTFTFSPLAPVLFFESAFILGEAAMSAGSNDFMSIDVSDGSTSYNLYYADTFSAFPSTSTRHGLPMTATSAMQINLGGLFPTATSATVLTLRVQLGNGGNALNDSRGYVDNFLLGPEASSAYYNGNGSNPSIYVVTPPIAGANLTASFDVSDYPQTSFTIAQAYSNSASANTMLGQLLVNPGSGSLFNSIQPTGSQHILAVPPFLSFLGVTGYSQGFLFQGGGSGSVFQFTNASTLTLGLETLDPPPSAAFNASPTAGPAPLTVSFINQSSGNITSYQWDFGDGNTSSAQNPVHTYTSSGTYSVFLVVSGPGGYDIVNHYDLIVVP